MDVYAVAPVLFEEISCANGRRIGVATLNAEKTLNALSADMTALLTRQLQAWREDAAIAIVVLQAAGEKAFCAGGDLQQLYRAMQQHHASAERDDIRGNRYALDFFEHEYRLDYLIHTYPKPILCWGHGIVMGGGIGLMAGASHRVVTERSRLAMPEITIGLFPDVGGSWFLSRMPGRLGLFLGLTGAAMNAEDACFAGLADYRIAHADKSAVIDALRQQNWSGDGDAALLSQVLLEAEQSALGQAAFAPSQLRIHYDLIDRVCRAPLLGGVVDAIAHIGGDDAWLQKAAKTLAAGAPGSVWLIAALQQRARHLSLAEVFRLELVTVLHCAARPDFAEGIRALIIDKDQQPRWQHASLAEVSTIWGEGFFVDPWSAAEHPLADLGR
ncbi:enoyl-CoA hydratase/isomerase family protein [Herbaspirillum sp. RTI4]|uniref:enoyl-CoA hydratase/isomerase family protein n=1 Tax=Herbaspirillum sp. RTI4 TaxID=3048640 RepID=UPI002AB3D1E5|nr:enoyl-CoA hydratase/isomerase family protein [Herbaspirillum sp. RTI4]MDY7577468.1 enoyl-CoA hydratase/isomerase family protein [Herbaspirillum sp. RTI4]MEA9981744.1 enoyl-CoA hydratase/isomerase family protein [Herbaspirillum sp. RTI4]